MDISNKIIKDIENTLSMSKKYKKKYLFSYSFKYIFFITHRITPLRKTLDRSIVLFPADTFVFYQQLSAHHQLKIF